MKADQLEIIYKNVNLLIPYVGNSRTHSKEQINQIAASIKEFGFTNPILLDGDDGIIAGHGRLSAALMLGIDLVPTIELVGLTDAQKKAYVIADNKLALNAGWDIDFLRSEIEALRDDGFDISLLGFDSKELADLLSEDNAENEYSDKVVVPNYEPKNEKPQIADVYDAEKYNRLIDSIESSNLPDDEKLFLKLASGRHVKINFQMVADYYAHSDAMLQQFIEDNALVIVDYDKAIELGYISIVQDFSEAFDDDIME